LKIYNMATLMSAVVTVMGRVPLAFVTWRKNWRKTDALTLDLTMSFLSVGAIQCSKSFTCKSCLASSALYTKLNYILGIYFSRIRTMAMRFKFWLQHCIVYRRKKLTPWLGSNPGPS
jgi:hypothetical protein